MDGKTSYDLKEERIPTYEESVQTNGQQLSLGQQLSDTRTRRINAILVDYVDPFLVKQVESGLYKTSLVLVPSNIAELQSSSTNKSVVGLASDDHVEFVQLHGHEYAIEFWRQPAVINELEGSLKARLAASGHRIYQPRGSEPPPSSPPLESAVNTRKKSFFSRRTNTLTSTQPVAPSIEKAQVEGNWGTKQPEELAPGEIKVEVNIQDVSLRIMTDMGLYETSTGKAVVVRMEVGY